MQQSPSTNRRIEEEFPSSAQQSVLMPSTPMPIDSVEVKGYDFNQGVDYSAMLRESYFRTGFQATEFGRAINVVNEMLSWRLSNDPIPDDANDEEIQPEYREKTRCKRFLGYTSNLVSSGLRENFRYLAQHRLVDVIVTTAGGIEEDFVKCLCPTYVLGGFRVDGTSLRRRGLNRIGNLVVPNDNYCRFEEWLMPILDQMLKEQKEQGIVWSPSKLIHRLGKEINNPNSIYYWCYRNNVPVYCPAITDGSLGDMIYFHSFKNPGLVLDLVQDIRALNSEAVHAKKTGMIILGGGLVKHHICNANLMELLIIQRNGADYAVYINTGQEFDGSDSGAHPDEAISWGKIRMTATPVKICADATLIFPLLLAETFARYQERQTQQEQAELER